MTDDDALAEPVVEDHLGKLGAAARATDPRLLARPRP
jgi:hypothetical protein